MIPLLEKTDSENGIVIFTATDGVRGTGVSLQMIDIESEDADLKSERLSLWLRTLSSKLRARFILKTKRGSLASSPFPRAESLNQIGFTEKNLTLVLEEARSPFSIQNFTRAKHNSSLRVEFKEALSSLRDLGFEFTNFTLEETEELFVSDLSTWASTIGSVETGSESIGVVRLYKTSSLPLTSATLSNLSNQIPVPFSIVTTLEKIAANQTELLLSRRLKQFQSDESLVGQTKAESAENTLVQNAVTGETLFNFELTVVLKRKTKSELREALQKTASALKNLGDVFIETTGTGISLVASQPGSSQHVPIVEKESVLPVFIPLFTLGQAHKFSGESKRAVSVHRRDESLFHLDLLDPNHQNANAVIVGSSGRGKSVFLGTLTQSLLTDENVRMIKVDVGGSHTRECAMNNGTEYKISIDTSSGLNPFGLITSDNSSLEFVRSVLGQFLESLLREEGELRLSKTIRSQIDSSLNAYLNDFKGPRSLDTFYDFAKDIPRRDLLSRWCKNGLYANAFRGDGKLHESRLHYFNFSEVFQAADPEFAQAAMAAVLATFNLEMRLYPEKRLVLVCDETPFFIERCFEFFI